MTSHDPAANAAALRAAILAAAELAPAEDPAHVFETQGHYCAGAERADVSRRFHNGALTMFEGDACIASEPARPERVAFDSLDAYDDACVEWQACRDAFERFAASFSGWHGPLMPNPADERRTFHYRDAHGTRGRLTVRNLRADLVRLADRVQAARAAFDGKPRRAPVPSKAPASSAPWRTAADAWKRGAFAEALAVADNMRGGAYMTRGPGGSHAPFVPHVCAEPFELGGVSFIVARSLSCGRFRVTHAPSGMLVDMREAGGGWRKPGATNGAAARAWIEAAMACDAFADKVRAAGSSAERMPAQAEARAELDAWIAARDAGADAGADADGADADAAPADATPPDTTAPDAPAAPADAVTLAPMRSAHVGPVAPVWRAPARSALVRLPLYCRIALERADADETLRAPEALADLANAYARTYGRPCAEPAELARMLAAVGAAANDPNGPDGAPPSGAVGDAGADPSPSAPVGRSDATAPAYACAAVHPPATHSQASAGADPPATHSQAAPRPPRDGDRFRLHELMPDGTVWTADGIQTARLACHVVQAVIGGHVRAPRWATCADTGAFLYGLQGEAFGARELKAAPAWVPPATHSERPAERDAAEIAAILSARATQTGQTDAQTAARLRKSAAELTARAATLARGSDYVPRDPETAAFHADVRAAGVARADVYREAAAMLAKRADMLAPLPTHSPADPPATHSQAPAELADAAALEWAALTQAAESRARQAAELAAGFESVPFEHPTDADRYALAGPDVTGADAARLTWFDAAGPSGHSGFASMADACAEALAIGYRPNAAAGMAHPLPTHSQAADVAMDAEELEALAEEAADKRARRAAFRQTQAEAADPPPTHSQAPAPWRPASGHPGGWRAWQDTPGGATSGRQLETKDARRPVLFRTMEGAARRCAELNAAADPPPPPTHSDAPPVSPDPEISSDGAAFTPAECDDEARDMREAANALHCGRAYPLAVFSDGRLRRELVISRIEHTGDTVTFECRRGHVRERMRASALEVLRAIQAGATGDRARQGAATSAARKAARSARYRLESQNECGARGVGVEWAYSPATGANGMRDEAHQPFRIVNIYDPMYGRAELVTDWISVGTSGRAPVREGPAPAYAPSSERVTAIIGTILQAAARAAPDGIPSAAILESEARRVAASSASMAAQCMHDTATAYRHVADSLRELAATERARTGAPPATHSQAARVRAAPDPRLRIPARFELRPVARAFGDS